MLGKKRRVKPVRVGVRFRRSHSRYNAGEVAGFASEDAWRLVRTGIAEYPSRWIARREKLRFAFRALTGWSARRLMERLREWYRGRYIPPPPNNPSSPFVVISPGHYEKPLLATCLRAIARFWLGHWQWIIGTAVAVVGIIVALT